jgi:hypothetical protein
MAIELGCWAKRPVSSPFLPLLHVVDSAILKNPKKIGKIQSIRYSLRTNRRTVLGSLAVMVLD